MAAYNFRKEFADKVASGEKCQTIRALGKRRHVRFGERLQLYTGMRTKGCRKLMDPDPRCVEVSTVVMDHRHDVFAVIVNGIMQGPMAMAQMALDDGFESVAEFARFFVENHGMPFKGVLIRWEPIEADREAA